MDRVSGVGVCEVETPTSTVSLSLKAMRHLMGKGLASLNVKELKQLENRLERGITRIRSKKYTKR